MSLSIIAMTGIVVGFLFLVVGFFMEDSDPNRRSVSEHVKDHRSGHKRLGVSRRKTA